MKNQSAIAVLESKIGGLKKRLGLVREQEALLKELAEHDLKGLRSPGGLARSVRAIAEVVCARHGLELSTLVSRSQRQGIVLPRQMVFFLSRRLTGGSFAGIGLTFGRDHGTVLFAVGSIEDRLATDKGFRAEMEGLERECRRVIGKLGL